MKTKTGTVQVGLPLPIVLRELVEKIVADDWVRYATTDDDSWYYILGTKAQAADQEAGIDHMSVCVPLGNKMTVIGEQSVNAQVASRKSGEYYLRRARKRLEDLGIAPSEIDRFLELFERRQDFSPVVAPWQVSEPARFTAFIDLLHALALRHGTSVDKLVTDAERQDALDAALEKVYLEELAGLFHSLVSRAHPLEQLEFVDPQLNEASRCFLYGFFRGAVVLSASALEGRLRTAVGPGGVARVEGLGKGFFNHLVDEAEAQGVLGARTHPGADPPLAVYSRRIFEERTRVVHKGLVPTKDLAEELLMKAREVIEHLHARGTDSHLQEG